MYHGKHSVPQCSAPRLFPPCCTNWLKHGNSAAQKHSSSTSFLIMKQSQNCIDSSWYRTISHTNDTIWPIPWVGTRVTNAKGSFSTIPGQWSWCPRQCCRGDRTAAKGHSWLPAIHMTGLPCSYVLNKFRLCSQRKRNKVVPLVPLFPQELL